MKRTLLCAALCLAVIGCLLWGLLYYAGTPREGVGEEPGPAAPEELEVVPLDLGVSPDGQGRLVFAFSLEDFVAGYNGLYWQDYQTAFLPSAEGWTKGANLTAAGEKAGDCYSATADVDVWFLPTITVYTREGEGDIRKLSVDLDEHSDTEEKHALFREMSLYTLEALFPDLEEDKRTALYETLDRQSHEALYPTVYSDELVPWVLYHQGSVGVFPFFALGEYQRLTFLPVTEDHLADLAAQGTQLVDLDQWEP